MQYIMRYDSPIGRMLLASDGQALTGAWFEGQRYFAAGLTAEREQKPLPVLEQAARWLDVYFSGKDPGCTPPLKPTGTPFQTAVWALLVQIPYGAVATYGDLARELERQGSRQKTSARAVGGAAGRNPVSVFIPCHRVIGTDGSLTGYAAGLEIKKSLLALEQGSRRA